METDEMIYRRMLRETRQKRAAAQSQANLARQMGKEMLALSIESQTVAQYDAQILSGLHGLASLGLKDEIE